MSNIYLYPKHDYKTLDSPNPYMLRIEAVLSEKHTIVNKNPNKRGIFDFFCFLQKADIYFLNWIEDIPVRRFGKLQVLFFTFFIILAKANKKKIIWVLHNKFSHERKNRVLIRFVFGLMMNHSDMIITHSQGGMQFVKDEFPKFISKIRYIIHPLDGLLNVGLSFNKEYDFLIWGTIYPYKGVLEFLEHVRNTPDYNNIKILVAGMPINPEIKENLKKYISGNINFIEKFLDMEEVAVLAIKSRFILFTYNSESILSSGSLMDSIRMMSIIIGPDKGSFRDLSTLSFIETYQSFDDILSIYNRRKNDIGMYMREATDFCHENSWGKFGEKLYAASSGIL